MQRVVVTSAMSCGEGQGFLSQDDKSFIKHKACDKQAQADVMQAMLRGQESNSAPLF
jgi:hypothetical protein